MKVKRKRSARNNSNSADMFVSSTSLDDKIRKFQGSMTNAMSPTVRLMIYQSYLQRHQQLKWSRIKMILSTFYQMPGLENRNVPMSPFITTPTRPLATPTIKNCNLMPEHRSISIHSIKTLSHSLNDSHIDYMVPYLMHQHLILIF